MFGNSAIQTVFETVFPPQCISCQAIVEKTGGLCGPCWRDTHFILGLACAKCGAPLIGDESEQDEWC
ncbi:MAG: double zinc ribbon domain-containing protein, partial [Paracoccaceae bacterium]|nr:double zinc ribbon domain-containing protein [Paracoccaceae bacterium]